jgi:hypothetical protein
LGLDPARPIAKDLTYHAATERSGPGTGAARSEESTDSAAWWAVLAGSSRWLHGCVQQEDAGGREFSWYAFPPPGYIDEEEGERPVEATGIRMMGEYGVTVPLWDVGGPLPDDPGYLERELGLSRQLVADLAAWGDAWDSDLDRVEHNAQARPLFARLQAELSPRFTVSLNL